MTEAQFKTIGIETGSIEMKNLNTVIKANGYTAVPPQNMANISTLIGGVVKDIYVLEGTYVAKGKTLATIQNLEVTEMQEDYNSAIANSEYLQLEYNRQIEENYTIYGTYRMKKTKEDHWDHKYGKRDEKFRILDIRNAVSKQKDQRKDITGKAATSYEIPELRSIAKALDIEINGTHNKPDLVRMIKRVLESQSRILK